MEDNQYRCESCNGIMEFDAATQTLRCPNCDSTLDIIKEGTIEEHSLSITRAAQAPAAWLMLLMSRISLIA